MKRIWGCLLAIGCVQPEPVGLTLQSVLPGAVEGVALEGSRARVGMDGQLCDVDVQTAAVLGDTDLDAAVEHVLDTRDGVIAHHPPQLL